MIGWRDGEDNLHGGSLFEVFAALSRGEVWSFPALRPHQRESWHAFVVQISALALIEAGLDTPPEEEGAWRDLLLALTPKHPGGEAWELVVDDWSKPALLQPPVVVPANRTNYKNRLATPDALDMLVTAKNHDVKQERIAQASEEDWLFALVTLQTTEGFLGAGNYGISRMNGGFASRMSLGVRPSGGGAAGAFRRDLLRLVADARRRPDRRTGLALLWTEPWDGTLSLDYQKLDELYVEICRRVRLRRGPQAIEALAAGSKSARVAAADRKGITGDPWAPIKADRSASHTPSGAGFGYRQMTQLLDAKKIDRPLLANIHQEDDRQGLSIVAAALVRGQGKTEGLHRRAVPISRIEDLGDYSPPQVLDRVGDVAKRRADDAGEAARFLARALAQVMQGGPQDRDVRGDDGSTKAKVEPWIDSYNDVVDSEFFNPPFWSELAGDADDHRKIWRYRLAEIASDIFEEAFTSGQRTESRRLRPWARARNYLDYWLKDWKDSVSHGDAS